MGSRAQHIRIWHAASVLRDGDALLRTPWGGYSFALEGHYADANTRTVGGQEVPSLRGRRGSVQAAGSQCPARPALRLAVDARGPANPQGLDDEKLHGRNEILRRRRPAGRGGRPPSRSAPRRLSQRVD